MVVYRFYFFGEAYLVVHLREGTASSLWGLGFGEA